MKFAIITHVPHLKHDQKWFAYSPYVNEMNVWLKNVDEVVIVAPISEQKPNAIHANYIHASIDFMRITAFDVKSLRSKLLAVLKVPSIIFTIYKAMKQADHIHIRCPGNIGLLGCFVQILFPKKTKTAKYAGNWDPKAKQPFSYKLQRWLLSTTFLTKNMTVLVYGEWTNSSKNIKPFFTATYSEAEKKEIENRDLKGVIELLFVGTLSAGKRPIYALHLAEALINRGYSVRLRFYGEGAEKIKLQDHIISRNLAASVYLMGNTSREDVKKAYQESHFLLLPSQSEGWPKAVAEAMFWGCIPVATNISAVNNMLDNGRRGIITDLNLEKDADQIIELLNNESKYLRMVNEAVNWSRTYTLDYFETEIQQLTK